MKPTLKAPGTKRLKLRHDELLTKIGFNFNLRRYTTEMILSSAICGVIYALCAGQPLCILGATARRCRLTLSKPVLKAPMVSAL